MDVATLLCVVQTLLASLRCSELKEVWSTWPDLQKLRSVVLTIKKVLLNAETKHGQLSLETREYIEELSFALYHADDLLDEVVTLAKQQRLSHKRKVGDFFTDHYNMLGELMSEGVTNITTELEDIATRHSEVDLSLDHNPITKIRDQTCSYPDDTEIVGRDEDVKEIVGKLLHSDVYILTIVGMGGMGKTTLVQHVFNHEEIERKFTLRLWISVSDHDQPKLDVKTILFQILGSSPGLNFKDCLLDDLVTRVTDKLKGKQFLIVLDDIWSESRAELKKLLGHLVGGKVGSHIVVTTRSKETAKMVGESVTYELRGLSEVYSWHLFKLMAFDKIDHDSPDKIIIGKDIIKICANVPLAIRVIGSLLYKQDKSKWQKVQQFGLANLSEGENGIMPILKLSYHNLEFPVRSCFSYCALYPKDSKINKEKLIRLWIAQGYVMPRQNGQSLEDVGEEYFSILLRRCFFHDVVKFENKITSFKLHDLMHDVASEVSENEIGPSNTKVVMRHVSSSNYDFTNAHIRTFLQEMVSYDYCDTSLSRLLDCNRLRTLDLSFVSIGRLPASIGKLIHLRYLNLSGSHMHVLPDSVTNLYNLQILDLGRCLGLKELPKNFSNLVNLSVLNLTGCDELTYMPSGMSKLVNLYELTAFKVSASILTQHAELEQLKALKKLTRNIEIVIHMPSSVVLATHNTIREGVYIRDKEHLDSIKLTFKHYWMNEGETDEEELLGEGATDYEEEQLGEGATDYEEEGLGEGATDYEEEGLGEGATDYEEEGLGEGATDYEEELLGEGATDYEEEGLGEGATDYEEELLGEGATDYEEELLGEGATDYEEELLGEGATDYEEELLGEGATDYEEELWGALQPHKNLKDLSLENYQGVRMPRWAIEDNLTSFLPNLVTFRLVGCHQLTWLPSLGNLQNLKELQLSRLPKLEYMKTPLEIVSVDGEASGECLQFFPCLLILALEYLPKFKGWVRSEEIGSIINCHQASLVFFQLSSLRVLYCRNLTSLPGCPNLETLHLHGFNERLMITSNPTSCPKLQEVLIISNQGMSWLDFSLPRVSFQSLTKLEIHSDQQVEDLGVLGRVFQACSSSLRELEITNCSKLRSVSGGLGYLSALEKLTLEYLPVLKLTDEDIEEDDKCDGMPWGGLCHTLQRLKVSWCYDLETFPKWMRKLTTLRRLKVAYCPNKLYERCQNPNGEDWPNIQHIPCIEFGWGFWIGIGTEKRRSRIKRIVLGPTFPQIIYED